MIKVTLNSVKHENLFFFSFLQLINIKILHRFKHPYTTTLFLQIIIKSLLQTFSPVKK